MSMTGFLKLHRKLKDNPVVMKDSDHLAVWVWLLIEAAWKPHQRMFGGNKILVEEGQLITSAMYIAEELKISESKVKRILKLFESDRQIEQQTTRYGRVITILRWNEYQCCDQQSERPMTDERTTSDRRVNETEEYKNGEKGKKGKKYTAEIEEIISYLNQMSGQKYRPTSKNAVTNITARLNDGFTVDDFKTVIYKKVKEWRGTDNAKYIRPETLFGTKFESYLNQLDTPSRSQRQPKGADELNSFYEMTKEWANE